MPQYKALKSMENRSGRCSYFRVLADDYITADDSGQEVQGPDLEEAWRLLVSTNLLLYCTLPLLMLQQSTCMAARSHSV